MNHDKDYNPTKKDILTIESIILERKKARTKLIERKIRLQSTLSELSSGYESLKFESKEFFELKAKRKGIKSVLAQIEIDIKKNK